MRVKIKDKQKISQLKISHVHEKSGEKLLKIHCKNLKNKVRQKRSTGDKTGKDERNRRGGSEQSPGRLGV